MIGVIDPDRLRTAVNWPDAVEAVRQALIDLGRGNVIQPPPVEVRMPVSGELHVKGGHIHGSEWIVVKVATGGFPDGPPTGCLLLVDAATGAPRWVLDDRGWLTQQRTAAAGALSTLTFSRDDARNLLLLGTGGLGRALIQAHRAVAPHLDIHVAGRDRDRAAALATDLGVKEAGDLESAVRGADAIVTATNSRTPLFDAAWVQHGTHVTALGADTVGKRELPLALLEMADLVVCDSVATALHAGELQHAGKRVRDHAVNWPDIAAKQVPATRRDGSITIADLCGIGAEDAAIAQAALAGIGGLA